MKLNFNPTYAVTRNISAKQVYISVPEIPDGYLYEDFRPPKKGEKFIRSIGRVVDVAVYDFNHDEPRIIIKEKPKPIVIDGTIVEFKIIPETIYGNPVEIPEGYKYVGFRPPHKGDYYLELGTARPEVAYYPYGSTLPRIIVEPVAYKNLTTEIIT